MKNVAMVSGACGGIGSATVKVLLERGWLVIGVDRQISERTVEGAEYIKGDVSEDAFVHGLFDRIEREHGRLDSLVNNAAIQLCKPLSEIEVDEWDHLMNNNVRSAFLCMKYGFDLLKTSHGNIVNVSSVHARQTSCDISAYAASKGALSVLTRAAALDYARYNIRVNAVLPGATDTGMLRAGLSRGHVAADASVDEKVAQLGRKHPLGDVGHPEDIAHAICFLADNEAAKFIVGEELVVDGGAIARLSTE